MRRPHADPLPVRNEYKSQDRVNKARAVHLGPLNVNAHLIQNTRVLHEQKYDISTPCRLLHCREPMPLPWSRPTVSLSRHTKTSGVGGPHPRNQTTCCAFACYYLTVPRLVQRSPEALTKSIGRASALEPMPARVPVHTHTRTSDTWVVGERGKEGGQEVYAP